MADNRKGWQAPASRRVENYGRLTPAIYIDDEATIKVASKKNPVASKSKTGGFKIKQKLPKIKEKDLAAWQEKFEEGMMHAEYVATLPVSV